MVNYECSRCGYNTNIKSKFISHLHRKYLCKPKLKDISVEEIYDNYFGKKKKDNFGKMSTNVNKMSTNVNIE